jgi:nitrate/nitrite-specific signal transduction histidine kinase
VRERKFDLVLLDVMMPEMDGYETLRLMKADPQLRDIPVIMISALDDIHSVVRCIELGAEDYLPKPFDAVLLRARIGACLEKKRLRDLEVEYLRNVDRVTAAAAAVEAGEFDPSDLEEVAGRGDALGQLARVFQRMAREVHAREQDLHDGLGPQLSGQALTIDAIRSLIKRDPAAAEGLLVDLKAQIQEAASDIRCLVYALRPPALDCLGPVGALRKRATQCEQDGTLEVGVEAPEEMPQLPAAVEVACYRIAEEALTNVVRHAAAHRCHISLTIEEGWLCLEVCDDGRGLAEAQEDRRTGVGLTSMRERATELGGRLVVEGRPEGGTCVRAELPLPEEEEG